ncbi:DUF4157 domain-containing protein [Nostocaceae cyanobacterium CENA369]|uniref:DUF4157 domain-containing protein n=1 Tax=Dendronalium phyllosphericum CENA369 TaxID=1725256 RepID=A0A8J7LH58_9NOST|nr:DUF4157 domain-containing protein [Dendronalium phyllosphericum]MBH8575833.1 DUF4157 domain-containing protein [Dendronalium phyllosphericum CENA369]
MYNKQHKTGKTSSNYSDTPASNQFAPRRFVVQPQAEDERLQPDQTPDLQTKSATTETSDDLANISIFPPGYEPPPPPRLQMKLTIGQPGDKYEQEADKVAADVVQQINAPQSVSVQPQKQPEEEELRKKPIVQRLSDEGEMGATPDLEASIQRTRGSGQPLAETIREPMEQAFGANFSGVKIHTGADSDRMNKSIQAKAFTTGQDVFFREGAYDPGSRGGQELIAHELTHVVQQTGSGKVQKSQERQLVNREIVSIGRAEKQIQRITDEEEVEFQNKYGKMKWNLVKNALTRIAKIKENKDYDAYKEATNKDEFGKACEIAFKAESVLNNNAKADMANDIVVPQSYYHVTKSFNTISGLVTTGAATCTGLAMSASNEEGETIYALTHIDGENDIPAVIDGMIGDMDSQIDGIVGSINAYIASGGVGSQGNLEHTPKEVVKYLQQKNVALKFASQLQQIRIGGKSQKDDLVRTNENVDQLHRKSGNKDVNGLIQQVTALPQMKGGHDWETLEQEDGYESGKHDPMEPTIQQVLERALSLQQNTPIDDQEGQQKLKNLKSEINKQKGWFEKYLFGKKLLTWATEEN